MAGFMAVSAKTTARAAMGAPDLQAIEKASTDPESPYFYPKLLRQFMANDTTMTPEAFQYFYYGTMFQEDYDPYRQSPNQALRDELAPIYAKEKRTRAEREKMSDYANQVLEDNPISLSQLTNRIFVYERNHKDELAKIWQYKLNHLLLVIAASGTGTDADNAYVVVYPRHEYDFLNLMGRNAESQRFEGPYYDVITTTSKGKTTDVYFNIEEMLKQYFKKHPSELKKK